MDSILSIDYKDWIINQKRLPDKTSNEAKSFFEFHKRLALDGFNMNGTYINPFLYWHLNMWHTDVDVIDEKGYISQKYINPPLRDNEWVITGAIHQANVEKKGLAIGGIRRAAKSTYEASYTGWGATFDENSQNVIAGLNSPDIKLITDKLDKGLNFLPWYYKWDRVEDNWKSQVTLGIKAKGGERYPFSYILIRNLDDGTNEEAIAGTKPRKLIIDEGAKGDFLSALSAAIPGFTTPYGWGCSPIVTFTGGDATKFNDAKRLFFDCGAFNFLEFPDKKIPGRTHGLFIGHTYRLEGKTESTLGAYLNKPELNHIKMMVSDIEKADKITDDNLIQAKKSSDRKTYLKEKMYYPKEVDDIFLNEDVNIFDIEGAKIQLSRLKSIGTGGIPVILKMTENGIAHEFTDKLPITNFPIKQGESKDAPVIIYEFPIESPPYGLYVVGGDTYRQGEAKYSDSLGTIYVYKRMHDITSEKYQDMMVASFAARPEDKNKWEEQARLLIEYYNARALVENDEISFIDYMIAKNKAHFLEKQPGWLKEIVPNTSQNRDYGLSRSSPKIINFLHNLLIEYCKEVIHEEKDQNGNVIKQVTGMSKIKDPMLLEEMIQYNEDGNFDRIVAFELALAQARKLDPILGKIGAEQDVRIQSLYKKKVKKPALFGEQTGIFTKHANKLFN